MKETWNKDREFFNKSILMVYVSICNILLNILHILN